jgi:hypothetical protein
MTVAFKEENGKYRWIVEFQCKDILNKIVFTGLNFYSLNKYGSEAQKDLKEM